MSRPCAVLIAACMSLFASASCSSHETRYGGDTHWLTSCVQDEDCGEWSCLCGVCTRPCSEDAACGGEVEAGCFDVQSPALLQRCDTEASVQAGGVCLAECGADSACGSGQTCMQGACVATDAADVDAGESTGSSGAVSEPTLHTSDFDDVSSEVPWDEPTAVPQPETVFAGEDAAGILGTWVEVDCDPGAEGTWAYGAPPRVEGCMHIVIARTEGDGITGTLFFEDTNNAPGPFAPPQADRGYPAEIDPVEYGNLQNPHAGTPYRLFDGRFENGRLTFWWSVMDFWHEWCALQSPFPWDIAGHTIYMCVPQDEEAQAAIDPGKVGLCVSSDFGQLCPAGDGVLTPCACLGVEGSLPPTCGLADCRCDREACDADVHIFHFDTELTLDGAQLIGRSGDEFDGGYELVLEREAP